MEGDSDMSDDDVGRFVTDPEAVFNSESVFNSDSDPFSNPVSLRNPDIDIVLNSATSATVFNPAPISVSVPVLVLLSKPLSGGGMKSSAVSRR